MKVIYNNLATYLNKIGKDKYIHSEVGEWLAITTTIILSFFIPICLASLSGFVTSLIAGVAKEIIDYKDYGVFNWWDLLATCYGGGKVLLLGLVLG